MTKQIWHNLAKTGRSGLYITKEKKSIMKPLQVLRDTLKQPDTSGAIGPSACAWSSSNEPHRRLARPTGAVLSAALAVSTRAYLVS